MPLLHRKPFVRQKPPADLRPEEEVFLCKVTHEVFRSYDEFFERTILCNSLVWSCALTGKPGLTYLEAVESEKRARQNLQNFPSSLVLPLLHLAALTHRTRLHELCDDVFSYAKDRFFPGEVVDVVHRGGARQLCEILEVQSPHSNSNGVVNGRAKPPDDGDTIVISDSDEEGCTPKAPKQANGRKKKPINPAVVRYKVQPIKSEGCEPIVVKAGQMSRRKNTLSRERLKLLLKQHCEPQDGAIALKASTIAKHRLAETSFSQFFPDEPPVFVFSPPAKGRGKRPAAAGSPGEVNHSQLKAAEEKRRLSQQKEEMTALVQEKARLKREKEGAMEARRREKEDKEKRKEELRKMFEDERQRRKEEKERMKLEKEKEREKLKEEKKKYAERLKLWSKPREDMECEDLQELPSPVPVKTRLPVELFGDALMVLEFLKAFGELFDLKDEFPDGVSLEVLEEALVGSNPEGPLCELLFFFLSAIFQALAEEQEEVANEQAAEADTKDLSEVLDDDADPTQSAISAVAALAAAWPQLHQGCSLKQLDLDSCTLSEILRLHLLASGADCSHSNAKFRYQKQGGFLSNDDPCVELRLANPALIKRLSSMAVYDLLPGEKLKILHALCGKLLTLVSTRDFIEDSAEEQRQTKQELREMKAEQHRREREEAAHRVRKRKEEKLKEQEQKLKELQERHEKMKEQENNNALQTAREGVEDMNTSTESHEEHQMEEEHRPSKSKKKKGSGDQEEKQAGPKEDSAPVGLTPEELQEEQEKVRELQERIQRAAACTYILPLGRDRLYRRYWLFPAAAALFVEDDYFGVTEDMLHPQPKQEARTEEGEAADEPLDMSVSSPASSAEASPAPVHACGPPVDRPNQWAFYSSAEEVERLIGALNPRGHRENTLREALLQEKERIAQLLSGSAAHRYNYTDKPRAAAGGKASAPGECFMENRLKDLMLDMEDRIYQGTLGSVKVMERSVWRAALEQGHYHLLSPEGARENGVKEENGELEHTDMDCHPLRGSARDRAQRRVTESESLRSLSPCVALFRLAELKVGGAAGASSGCGTPQPVNNAVRLLAQALAQVEQGIERKFLKAPLGDEDSKKDQKAKKKDKKKDEDQSSDKDDGSDCGRVCKTVLERWRESLQACSSLSQVFLHLSTLERSVLWAKSLLNARCKLCRRKGDADNMLLCDGCDRGHHIHCVRPKLKAVPAVNWFCPGCRPKQRANRLTSRQRSSVDSEEEVEEEEESEEEEAEDSEEEEEEEESEEESEEEEEEEVKDSATKKGRAAVKLPPPAKGGRSSGKVRPGQATPRSQQTTPRSQQTTPRQAPSSSGKAASGSASRGSGKKATPASNGRAPPRAGSRASSRLSHEILAPNAAAGKTPSRAQKRPLAEVSTKPVLLAPSASSSSRRSSGRAHGVHEFSACERLIVELVRHPDSWPFLKLVSRTQVPDYYDIIKKPIALSTIREKVNDCQYKTSAEYIDDVELMFANCLQYNPRHTNEAKAGARLQAFFHSELQKLGLSERTSPPQKRPRM